MLYSTFLASDPIYHADGYLCRDWPSELLRFAAGARPVPLIPNVTLHSLGLSSHPGESSQLLHPDLKFDPSSNPPSYTSQDQVNPPNPLVFSSSISPLSSTGYRKQHENTHKNYRYPRRRDGNRGYFPLSCLPGLSHFFHLPPLPNSPVRNRDN
jgi:hypothetical protein